MTCGRSVSAILWAGDEPGHGQALHRVDGVLQLKNVNVSEGIQNPRNEHRPRFRERFRYRLNLVARSRDVLGVGRTVGRQVGPSGGCNDQRAARTLPGELY